MVVEFVVVGEPKTKGNLRAVRSKSGKSRLINKSDKTAEWESQVSWVAKIAMRGREMFQGTPVAVVALFALPRPKAPKHPAAISHRTGDLDKLQRCVGDALSGIVYGDDCEVISWQSEKFYVDEGMRPGVFVRVEKLREYQYTGSIGWYRRHLEELTE